MATSLAAMMARRAANLARLGPSSSSVTRASSLIPRRGLAGAADHHGPPKVDFWKDPMSPSKWKEAHLVIISVTGWGLLIFGGYKAFSGGKKDKQEISGRSITLGKKHRRSSRSSHI